MSVNTTIHFQGHRTKRGGGGGGCVCLTLNGSLDFVFASNFRRPILV